MTNQIEIDDEVYAELQAMARPFEDTPNTVLRRLLHLDDAEESAGTPASQIKTKGRALTNMKKRRAVTPQKNFRGPILEILQAAGGGEQMDKILDEVERRMAETFTEGDLSPVSTGEVRWRNAARWERSAMVRDGLIEKTDRWGVWELTPEGMNAGERHQVP